MTFDRSSTSCPREPLPSTSASSSLSPSADGPSRSSFSRGRSCGATSFIVYTQTLMQVRPLRAWVLALLLLTACGTPPHKEMDQAQGAIDAARAAGAERYAAEEFAAATGSLTLATNAVNQRDYRLALNHALESREHAQNAARQAAETAAAAPRRRGPLDDGNNRAAGAGELAAWPPPKRRASRAGPSTTPADPSLQPTTTCKKRAQRSRRRTSLPRRRRSQAQRSGFRRSSHDSTPRCVRRTCDAATRSSTQNLQRQPKDAKTRRRPAKKTRRVCLRQPRDPRYFATSPSQCPSKTSSAEPVR